MNSTFRPGSSANISDTSLLEGHSPPDFVTRRNPAAATLPTQRSDKDFQNNVLDIIDNWFCKQDARMAQFTEEFQELKVSVKFMSGKIDELNNYCKVIHKRVEALEDKVESQSNQVMMLEAKIDFLEQQSRQCNVEICNIPERRAEDLMTIVENLGVALKCNINRSDISYVHRVPHANKQSPHPKNIILKFNSRTTRDNVLSASRMIQGLKSSALNISGLSRIVYVNEHLTLKNKHLFREAREAARAKNYRFVWIKHGTVLVREKETSAVNCNPNHG